MEENEKSPLRLVISEILRDARHNYKSPQEEGESDADYKKREGVKISQLKVAQLVNEKYGTTWTKTLVWQTEKSQRFGFPTAEMIGDVLGVEWGKVLIRKA